MLFAIAALCMLAGSARAQYDAPDPPGYQNWPAYPDNEHPPQQDYVATPGDDGRALARELLEPQNEVRAAVGEQPLLWSDRLADVALDWADRLLASGQFQHRPADPFGENLYEMIGGTASPQQVIAAWADEARSYDVRTNTCTAMCGHYTQIVWAATREVGCAVVGNANREIWVCEYNPPGNVVGYRPY